MWIQERFKRLFRLRFAIFYPLVLYILLFAEPTDASLRCGSVLILIGLSMRLWSNGYAIKMDKLTTSGPYAFVRNPLYLGTAIIALGLIVTLEIYLVGVFFLVAGLFVYRRTIKKEERMLTEKFGSDFLDYKKKVPLLLPTIFPYKGGEKWAFSPARLFQSREHKVVLWVVIAMIAFHLRQEALVEGEAFTLKENILVAMAILLAVIDVMADVFRKRIKARLS